MKTKFLRLVSIMVTGAIFCAGCILASCGAEETGEGVKIQRWNTAEFVAQNEKAESIYNSIYDMVGSKSAAVSANAIGMSLTDNELIELDDVLALLDKYEPNAQTEIVGLINTYIADIFSYSQIQLSLIEEYESEALVGTYNVDYSNVDWGANLEIVDDKDVELKNMLMFLSSVKPFIAQFIGVNQNTNKAYIAQTHRLGSSNSEAKLEYFYDEQTGDMGVTTLNWHYSLDTGEFNGFEYHFCDAVNNFVMTARGTLDSNAQLKITNVSVYTEEGVFNMWSEEDKELVFGYVISEINRIEAEMDRLAEQNAEIVNQAKDFEVPEEPRSVLVKYDYSILKSMIKHRNIQNAI